MERHHKAVSRVGRGNTIYTQILFASVASEILNINAAWSHHDIRPVYIPHRIIKYHVGGDDLNRCQQCPTYITPENGVEVKIATKLLLTINLPSDTGVNRISFSLGFKT